MPLKLGRISQQMQDMAQTMANLLPAEENLLERARDCLRSIPADALCEKLEWQRRQPVRMPWLVAFPRSSPQASLPTGLADTAPPPSVPSTFSVVGVDASSIPPDRHSSVHYYLVNVGYALLTYGREPDAILEASSQLCFRDEDLYVFPEKRDVPIEGMLLSARMEVEALRLLQQVLDSRTWPTLALLDGPLILWTLQNETQEVQRALLQGFLSTMDFLKETGVPPAGYVSYTGSRDVTNSLRVWLCQGQPNECDRCASDDRELCLALAKIRDRELYAFLADGERSQLFGSSSQILEEYGEQRVDFFYMNVGEEIVRVEVPRWVASDADLLSFVHAAIYDQCQRSPGVPPYPPVLQEAHEQAAITAPERRLVEEMVEQALGQYGRRVVHSAKEDSKRRRGV